MAGRKPLPTHLKLVKGTARPPASIARSRAPSFKCQMLQRISTSVPCPFLRNG